MLQEWNQTGLGTRPGAFGKGQTVPYGGPVAPGWGWPSHRCRACRVGDNERWDLGVRVSSGRSGTGFGAGGKGPPASAPLPWPCPGPMPPARAGFCGGLRTA